jgi:rhodanese-related sulfurtransferase
MRRSVDRLLADARRRLRRLTPQEAFEAAADGAIIVDVRSRDEQERQGGLIPGAVQHPLTVLLWRLDPDVPTSNPKLPLDTRLILICREGYSSSLAAADLQAIGFTQATDVIGGFDAWLADGLPVEPVSVRALGS